ncbi:hypothetical protein [Actinoplanes aureus]|uniref:Uncharacterized protein n=1 Tax=Actinoplanes aureus TaxID=2792083 RepID=A0A931CFB2_9ACTN|nr:hypothetical protein [Actinoplanes aureus]MBG0566196.1 hypothetical protein [Actinoplanes aureus]
MTGHHRAPRGTRLTTTARRTRSRRYRTPPGTRLIARHALARSCQTPLATAARRALTPGCRASWGTRLTAPDRQSLTRHCRTPRVAGFGTAPRDEPRGARAHRRCGTAVRAGPGSSRRSGDRARGTARPTAGHRLIIIGHDRGTAGHGGTRSGRTGRAPPALLVDVARRLPESVRPAIAVRAGGLGELLGRSGPTRAVRPGRTAAGAGLSGHGRASFLVRLRRDSGASVHPAGTGPLNHTGGAVGHRAGPSGHRRGTRTLAPGNDRWDNRGRGPDRPPVAGADPPGSGHAGRPARLFRSTRVPAALGFGRPSPAARLAARPPGTVRPGLAARPIQTMRPGLAARPIQPVRARFGAAARAVRDSVAPGALVARDRRGGVSRPVSGVLGGRGVSGTAVPAGRLAGGVALLGAGPAATGPPGAFLPGTRDAGDRTRRVQPARSRTWRSWNRT